MEPKDQQDNNPNINPQTPQQPAAAPAPEATPATPVEPQAPSQPTVPAEPVSPVNPAATPQENNPPATPAPTAPEATAPTPPAQPETMITPTTETPSTPPPETTTPPTPETPEAPTSTEVPASTADQQSPQSFNTSTVIQPGGNVETVDTSSEASPSQAQPVVGSVDPVPTQNSANPTTGGQVSNSKKKVAILAVIGLIVVGALGYLFAYHLPNLPGNVYRTGLDRTGKVMHDLIVDATEQEAIEKFANSSVSMGLNVTSADGEFKGTFASNFNETASDSKLDISMTSAGQSMDGLGLQVVTDIAEDNRLPDIFFRVNGLKQMNLDSFMPGIGEYDNRWISFSSDYLEELMAEEGVEIESEEEITHDDAASLVRSLSEVTNRYIFTSNQSDAVIEQREFTGEEEIEGRRTYRYVIGLNKPNLIRYCQSASEVVFDSQVYRKITSVDDEKVAEEKEKASKECETDIEDELDEDYTMDMWIDRQYKLIHKVRAYDPDNQNNYVDFGQRYTGGDELTLFTEIHDEDEKMDASFTATTNSSTSITNGNATMKNTDRNGYTVILDYEIKPAENDFNVECPTDAIDIRDLMEALYTRAYMQPYPQPYAQPVLGSTTEETVEPALVVTEPEELNIVQKLFSLFDDAESDQ